MVKTLSHPATPAPPREPQVTVGEHGPCLALPSHSLCGVRGVLLPRGMLAAVLSGRPLAAVLGLQ